jgi:hypothetical protein
MTQVARRYYPNELKDVPLPYALGHGITLHDPKKLSAPPGSVGQYRFCASIDGVEERNIFSWFFALEKAIHLHSGASFDASYTITKSGFEHTDTDYTFGWGDNSIVAIGEPAIRFAARVLPDVARLFPTETFNRVSNAMHLYNEARMTRNPDFALLGFIGCLESLFSIAPQELNFRLCVSITKFSRDTPEEQRSYFRDLKKLYTLRSKVAHGDKIHENEERAAIQLVEHWVPTAGHVCREALFRLIDHELVAIFNQKPQHERFLEYLLFYPNLTETLAIVRRDVP